MRGNAIRCLRSLPRALVLQSKGTRSFKSVLPCRHISSTTLPIHGVRESMVQASNILSDSFKSADDVLQAAPRLQTHREVLSALFQLADQSESQKYVSDGRFIALKARMDLLLENLDVHEIPIFLYAYAKLNLLDEKAVTTVGDTLLSSSDVLRPEEVATVVSILGEQDESLVQGSSGLIESIVRSGVARLSALSNEAFADMLYGLVRLGPTVPALFDVASAKLRDESSVFSNKALSSIALACAQANHREYSLLGDIAQRSSRDSTITAELVDIGYSFSQLGYKSSDVLRTLISEGQKDEALHALPFNSVARLLYSLAMCELKDEGNLIQKVVSRCLEGLKQHEIDRRGLIEIVWSHSVLGLSDSVRPFFAELCPLVLVDTKKQLDSQLKRELDLLHQSYLSLMYTNSRLAALFPPRLIWLSRRSFEEKHERIDQGRQEVLSETRRQFPRFNLVTDYLTETGYTVDMADVKRKLAVEFERPSQFIVESSGQRHSNGATKLKHKILNKAGWKVVNVPMYEWQLL
eukprot:Colp12_sorted_trinity150504_noHs@6074